MTPKLRENPRDWQKFTTAMMVVAGLLGAITWRRGWLSTSGWLLGLGAVVVVIGTVWIYPKPFRRVYRLGMTVLFHVGQVIGRILLTLLFFVVVLPMGLALRVMGKDLLRLRRPQKAATYWLPSGGRNRLDQMF